LAFLWARDTSTDNVSADMRPTSATSPHRG
jgi:hypothetical protein